MSESPYDYVTAVDPATFLFPPQTLAALDARNPVTPESVSIQIGEATADLVTTAGLTAALANVPYWVTYNGSAWPGSRPAGAGSRPVVALGGAVGPVWLDTGLNDVWLGTTPA